MQIFLLQAPLAQILLGQVFIVSASPKQAFSVSAPSIEALLIPAPLIKEPPILDQELPISARLTPLFLLESENKNVEKPPKQVNIFGVCTNGDKDAKVSNIPHLGKKKLPDKSLTPRSLSSPTKMSFFRKF